MKRKKSFVPFGIATAALVALAAGALVYQQTHSSGGQVAPPEVRASGDNSVPQAVLPEAYPTPKPFGTDNQVTIYQVASDDNGSHLKKVTVTVRVDPNTKELTAQEALNAMASETDSPLPGGTHADSYTVSNGVATVDFNQAFVDNFKGGDEAEALTMNAVLATIGQFGPHFVQITVAGKKIDSLGGNLSLANPVPVPQASEQTAQSTGAKP